MPWQSQPIASEVFIPQKIDRTQLHSPQMPQKQTIRQITHMLRQIMLNSA